MHLQRLMAISAAMAVTNRVESRTSIGLPVSASGVPHSKARNRKRAMVKKSRKLNRNYRRG